MMSVSNPCFSHSRKAGAVQVHTPMGVASTVVATAHLMLGIPQGHLTGPGHNQCS
ncbi:Uncharacterized protein DAT39_015383, partial [Clarias magur]